MRMQGIQGRKGESGEINPGALFPQKKEDKSLLMYLDTSTFKADEKPSGWTIESTVCQRIGKSDDGMHQNLLRRSPQTFWYVQAEE